VGQGRRDRESGQSPDKGVVGVRKAAARHALTFWPNFIHIFT